MANPTALDVIDAMTSRFTSANEVKVERAQITREEWLAILNAFEDSLFENHNPTSNAKCKECVLLAGVSNAREMLS